MNKLIWGFEPGLRAVQAHFKKLDFKVVFESLKIPKSENIRFFTLQVKISTVSG